MMKKRLFAELFTAMVMVSMMASSALAAEPEAGKDRKVHTLTLDAGLVPLAGEASVSKSAGVGLALEAGSSGWSTVYELKFSAPGIPFNAVIQDIAVVPGTADANAGHPQMQGVIVASQMKLTAPNAKSTTMTWNKTMETTALNGAPVRGTWALQLYGTNVTRPIGDWTDSIRFGSVHYKNCSVTVTYTA